MTSTSIRRARIPMAALGLLTATLVAGLVSFPALASSPTKAAAPSTTTVTDGLGTLGDPVAGIS